MTVSNTTSRNQYTATSGQTVFPYTFEIFDKNDIAVLKNGTLLSEGTNYTVSGVGNDSGGNITLTVGATAGDILTLYRDMAYQRLTDYQNSGDFLAQEVNDDFDRLWLAAQQNSEGNDRAIVKPITDSASIDMTLPSAVDRANSYLTFDATGAPSVVAAGDPSAPDAITRQDFTGDGATLVYTLASAPGAAGAGVMIFIDGVQQDKDSYTITGTTLTFSEAPPLNSNINLVQLKVTSIGEADSASVTYIPAGTGAVQTSVQSKLRETVSVKDFGAVGDGVTDDTVSLKAAFDYAVPLAKTVLFPSGTYKITGPIQPYATRTSGSIHIFADGLVQIVVDASSTAFTDVLYLETTNFNSCSITGGIFEINGNNKAGRGITFRHNDASGGDVNITAEVKIKNIKENDASATRENQAISVYGDYGKINIENIYIENIQRTNAAGATKGLAVSQFGGYCSIENVFVKDVLLPSVTDADADGIAVFGKSGASTYNKRGGVAYVSNCVFEDCQGRALKSQISEITVMRPRVKRRAYVGMANSVDFDFQTGGHALLVEPLYEYFENGGVSPLGSSHSCVAFQQLTDDTENVAKSIGGTIVTQVQIPRYALGVYVSTAKESYLEVSNLTVMPVDGFTSAAFDRAIIEFDGGDIESKTEKSEFVARNIRGPLGVSPIAYIGYSSGSVASKLSLTVTDCFNTHSTVRQVFDNLSGSEIAELETFTIFNNRECASIMNSGFTFDFSDLAPGNQFVVDIATINATNAPSWGSSGYAMIETLSTAFGGGFTFIRVTTDSNKSFFTWYPAGGWNSSPQKSSATFTATNVTTDRTFDADSTTVAELADVLGTLISDLKSANILS